MKMLRREFLMSAGAAAVGLAAGRTLAASAGSERKSIIDPDTGVHVWQITSFPTVNQNLYFHSRCWTADGKTFLFQSLRSATRDSGSDLYRADVDGMGLERVTKGIDFGNIALHPSKRIAYYHTGNEIFTVDIDTKAIEKVGAVEGEGSVGGHPGSFTDDGRLYCFVWVSKDGTQGFGTFDTSSKKSKLTPLGLKGRFTHIQIEPGKGKIIQFCGEKDAKGLDLFVADESGKIEALPFTEGNGHNAWLGATGKVYTATLGKTRNILCVMPGSDKVEVVAKAPPRFWHPGVSPEGDWIVSDTNAEDQQLHLISVKTGKHKPLCRVGSTGGHAQWTHPHPSVSPGGRHVLFNSDRTGIPHVYVAEIPEELKRAVL